MYAATYDKSYWQDFIFEQGGGILCNNSHEFAEVMQTLARLGFVIGFKYMEYLDKFS